MIWELLKNFFCGGYENNLKEFGFTSMVPKEKYYNFLNKNGKIIIAKTSKPALYAEKNGLINN